MMDEMMKVMTDCRRSDAKSNFENIKKFMEKCGETKSGEEETARHGNERPPDAERGEGQIENCCRPTTLGK
jgi:hypothetical protein